MKDVFINECLLLLKRQDIKENLKEFISPIIQPIVTNLLKEINPYIYMIIMYGLLLFILNLAILILLILNLRNILS